MCGINYKISPLRNSGVRRWEEHIHKSTNFGQSQWLIGDLFTQQGGGRSDPQEGDKTFI